MFNLFKKADLQSLSDQKLMDYARRLQRVCQVSAGIGIICLIATGGIGSSLAVIPLLFMAAACVVSKKYAHDVARVSSVLEQRRIKVDQTLGVPPWLVFRNTPGVVVAPAVSAPTPPQPLPKDEFISPYTTRELPYKRVKFKPVDPLSKEFSQAGGDTPSGVNGKDAAPVKPPGAHP